MTHHQIQIREPFNLELGDSISNILIHYSTAGQLNNNADNVIWVFHALTANSDPLEWWPGLFGEGKFFDPKNDFIICANVLGSCYGTTGPCSEDVSLEIKGLNFPQITVKDINRLHVYLADHLNIKKVKFAIGGSFGGYQALEFSLGNIKVENLVVIASSTVESPWNIAIHETQRQAIQNDPTLTYSKGGKKGLETARGIGMLMYRTPQQFESSQPRKANQTDHFDASSYIKYQGKKLADRFSAHSYLTLINCLDTHDLGRGRHSIEKALSLIDAKTLFIGIEQDLLANPERMEQDSKLIPKGRFEMIQSSYGHDGFLIETEKITQQLIKHFN